MDKKESSNVKIVLKTVAIASASVLTVGVIGTVILFFCFPFIGFRATYSLGLKDRALFFAEMYAKSDNIDGLVYCVQLSDELLQTTDEENAVKRSDYAEKLISYTEDFFLHDPIEDYFAQIDDYYMQNAPVEARVSLYSYYDYIVSRNYYARAIVGKYDKMIFRNEPTDIVQMFELVPTIDELAVIYSSAADAAECRTEAIYDQNGFTALYYGIKQSVLGYAEQLESVQDTLETLYLMRKLMSVVDGIDNVMQECNAKDHDWREEKSKLKYHGNAISEAYANLLSGYISMYKGE